MSDMKKYGDGGFRKDDSDRPRPELISPYAEEREAQWLSDGAKEHAVRNWEKGIPFSRCMASLERHTIKIKQGLKDEDHLSAVRCNAGFMIHFEEMIRKGKLPASLNDLPGYEEEDYDSKESVKEEEEDTSSECYCYWRYNELSESWRPGCCWEQYQDIKFSEELVSMYNCCPICGLKVYRV